MAEASSSPAERGNGSERLAVDERSGGVDAGPLHGRLAQLFLRAVAEMVLQAIPLSSRLVGYDDLVKPAMPERALPAAKSAADLLGNVPGQVLHETGELLLTTGDA